MKMTILRKPKSLDFEHRTTAFLVAAAPWAKEPCFEARQEQSMAQCEPLWSY